MTSRLLTASQVAEQLHLSVRTVYRLIHEGQLIGVWFRRTLRVPESSVLGYLATRRLGYTTKAPSPCVYFIRGGVGSGRYLIKIGFARDVEKRLRSLQTGSSRELELIGTIPARTICDERTLHERFRHHRSRGEWFHPAPDILAFIRERSVYPSSSWTQP